MVDSMVWSKHPAFSLTTWRLFSKNGPGSIPEALWRRLQMGRAVVIAATMILGLLWIIVVVGLVVDFDRTTIFLRPFGLLVLNGSWVVVCAGFYVLVNIETMRLKRIVGHSAGAVCERCEYNLTGLPAESYCSECGQRFVLCELQKKWGDWASGKGGVLPHS